MAEISALARPAPERFDSETVWSTLPPEAQARIGAAALDLALILFGEDLDLGPASTVPAVVRRALDRAHTEAHRELEDAVEDAVPRSTFLAGDGATPRIPASLGGVCRVCGCSQNDACAEGCAWAAEDLCTACVGGER